MQQWFTTSAKSVNFVFIELFTIIESQFMFSQNVVNHILRQIGLENIYHNLLGVDSTDGALSLIVRLTSRTSLVPDIFWLLLWCTMWIKATAFSQRIEQHTSVVSSWVMSSLAPIPIAPRMPFAVNGLHSPGVLFALWCTVSPALKNANAWSDVTNWMRPAKPGLLQKWAPWAKGKGNEDAL